MRQEDKTFARTHDRKTSLHVHSPFTPGLTGGGDTSLGELPVVEYLSLVAGASPLLGRGAVVPFSATSSGSSANTSRFEPNASRERAL